MISQITTAGAMPTLEAAMRFAGQRQKLLAHNIANLSTPGFQPKDVSVRGFQQMLADAVEARRSENGGTTGELDWKDSREIAREPGGRLRLSPRSASGNILFHDRNDRDLERSMQDLVENASYFRAATDLIRQQKELLLVAITQRI